MTLGKATKLILLFAIVAFLLLLPIIIADATNDVAAVGTSNGTTTQLTAVWTEYSNLSISTGSGNTSVYLSAVVSTNSTLAKLYGRIKRDGTVIESINLSQSVYPETATYVVPVAETAATHIYTFEAYCTSGKLCTISNRTFSAVFINTGSFAASVTNVTTSYPFTSTYGTTPVIGAPVASASTGGYLDSTNWTIFNNTNATATTHTSQIGTLQSNDTSSDAKISALQANSSYFNGTVFPQSTEFRNSTAVTANNTANSAVQTSTYNGNFPNSTNLPDAKNYTNSTNSSMKGYVDSGLAGKEPTIATGSNNYFWNGSKQFVQLLSSHLSDFNSAVLSLVNGTVQLQSVSQVTGLQGLEDSQNQSSANNNTASQNRDDLINSTKANKTNIGEFTGGKVLDSLLFFSLNGTNATALSANTTANNTNATLTSHVVATGTAVHGLGNISTQNNNAVNFTGGVITGISSWDAINNTISVNISQVRNVTTDNVSEGAVNLYYKDARVLVIGNVTYLRLSNITTCTGGTNRTNFNGTAFTCEVDQTSAFSFIVTGGQMHTGSVTATAGTGITFTDVGGVWTISSPAAGVTNATVDPQSFNWSNGSRGTIDFNKYATNVTINLTSGVNVAGQLPDANLASTFVKSVGGSGVIQSSGGQNPTISLVGAIPNASIPASAANLSKDNNFNGNVNVIGAFQFGGNTVNTNWFVGSFTSPQSGAYGFSKTGAVQLSINDTTGNVDIGGVLNPSYKLQVEGTVAFPGLGAATSGTTLVLTGGNEIRPLSSSNKTKHDIKNVESTEVKNTLCDITKVGVNQFKWDVSNVTDYGLIADDVAQICPEVVNFATENITLGGVNYIKGDAISINWAALTSLELQKIKEQDVRLQKLEDRGILDIMFAKQINYLYNYFNITKP